MWKIQVNEFLCLVLFNYKKTTPGPGIVLLIDFEVLEMQVFCNMFKNQFLRNMT
jgi:hypothetical protein